MKLSDVNESEEFEAHDRTKVQVAFDLSFAHEIGLDPAFNQLFQHPHFKAALEDAFSRSFKDVAQKMIMSSSIPPGHGWMDDIENTVAIAVGETQRID